VFRFNSVSRIYILKEHSTSLLTNEPEVFSFVVVKVLGRFCNKMRYFSILVDFRRSDVMQLDN